MHHGLEQRPHRPPVDHVVDGPFAGPGLHRTAAVHQVDHVVTAGDPPRLEDQHHRVADHRQPFQLFGGGSDGPLGQHTQHPEHQPLPPDERDRAVAPDPLPPGVAVPGQPGQPRIRGNVQPDDRCRGGRLRQHVLAQAAALLDRAQLQAGRAGDRVQDFAVQDVDGGGIRTQHALGLLGQGGQLRVRAARRRWCDQPVAGDRVPSGGLGRRVQQGCDHSTIIGGSDSVRDGRCGLQVGAVRRRRSAWCQPPSRSLVAGVTFEAVERSSHSSRSVCRSAGPSARRPRRGKENS